MAHGHESGPLHIEQFILENSQEVSGALVDPQNMIIWGILGIISSFIPNATIDPESGKRASPHSH
jgi:hypothetical protein